MLAQAWMDTTPLTRPAQLNTEPNRCPFSSVLLSFFLAREAKRNQTIQEYDTPLAWIETTTARLNRDHHRSRSASPRRLEFFPPQISPSPPWTRRTRAPPQPPATPRPPGSTGWGPPLSGSATRVASSSALIPGPALVRPSLPIDLCMPQEILP
jgi:hypothetical protein